MSFLSKVLPVIVLYGQDFTNSHSIVVLDSYISDKSVLIDLFVYDNSPECKYEEQFRYHNFNVRYIHDPSNAGVSKAYNSGANYAKAKSKEWILLLDQDTEFPANYIDSYEHAVKKNSGVNLFAPVLKTKSDQIMSPCRYFHKRGYWLKEIPGGNMDAEDYSPVNSGMLINLKAFFEVGGYNEKVKLDFADFQFVERYSKVYGNFHVINLICIQDFSGFEKDFDKLKHRFAFFCQGAKNCDRNNFSDRWWYFLAVFRRMAGLVLRTRSFSFVPIFFQNYIT